MLPTETTVEPDDFNQIVAAFRDIPTPILSDNLERLSGCIGLTPYYAGGRMVGRAFTVHTRAGDNLVIHRALQQIAPGDVLVVDGAGDTTRALVGEIMKSVAESRGAVGFVIDGAIRDVEAFTRSSFPCFARAAIHRGPYKSGPGVIGIPISVGGWVIRPGDIVVGDADGVLSFAASDAARLLEAAQAQCKKEEDVMESIRRGTYIGYPT